MTLAIQFSTKMRDALCFLVGYAFFFSLANCNEVYNGGIVSDALPADQSTTDDDPHCKHHIHKFYQQLKCLPELSPGAKCPTSYKCATLQGISPDLCYYAGHLYPVGYNLSRTQADFLTPCIHSCQCVRMYEGAQFYCYPEPVPSEPLVCPSAPGCRHFSFLDNYNCCERGVTSCGQGKKGSVKCVYVGRSYSEGERIFTSDDIKCTQCICAEGFNGTIAPPYCEQYSCALEMLLDFPVMLRRGCIPLYFSDQGCCPAAFRCPKPTDRVIKPEKTSSVISKTDKKCHFGNLTMEVGDQLSPWHSSKHVDCSCRVPPMASCVRRNFVFTEELRREFAREGLDTQS